MRISKSLINHGISEEWQLTICGTCRRDRSGNTTNSEHKKILRLCDKIGGEFSKGLYRYLTDKNITHDFISMEYLIPKDKIFEMKRRFYAEWVKDIA